MSQMPVNNENGFVSTNMTQEFLTDNERDALGEIGNICMGTSATTLSQLLGKRVTITTPIVSVVKGNEYLNEYEKPVVATEVSYIQGIEGINIFLIKKDDALAITEVLMGTSAGVDELYLSAISEVMNQMVGSSSTALADILHVSVNITPPVIRELTPTSVIEHSDEILIKTSFLLDIEGLLQSNILQIMPYNFGRKLVATLMGDEPEPTPQTAPAVSAPSQPETMRPVAAPEPTPQTAPAVSAPSQLETMRPVAAPVPNPPPAPPQPYVPAPQPQAAPPHMQSKDVQTMVNENDEKIELKAVKFQSFDKAGDYALPSDFGRSNIDLIIDVPLNVTVVLGRTKKSIKEILDLGRGSVIVLDRLAGEMVDVLVNGKVFARGEVVVIDENYGVRITEITSEQAKEE